MKREIKTHLLLLISGISLSLALYACGLQANVMTDATSKARNLNKPETGKQSSAHIPQNIELGSNNPVHDEIRHGSKPTSEQVEALVQEEFGGLFKVAGNSFSPFYIIGDFNGDKVDDIAISVAVNCCIDPTDRTQTPFWFGKPLWAGAPSERESECKLAKGNLAGYHDRPALGVLAMIHGSSERGWSYSQPQQKFVLVDGWDIPKKTMKLYRGQLKPTIAGDEPKPSPPPHLFGDAILMITEGDKGTVLYWDGKRYRWYPIDNIP